MSERYPNVEGGACADLAPEVAAKYFDINTQKQVFERQTAIAICGHCAVRSVCLEAAMQMPIKDLHGVRAGMTPPELKTLIQWRDYEVGTRVTAPDKPKPSTLVDVASPAVDAGVEYRHTSTLSFEERVRGVFLDLRAGKYNGAGGISQAIGAIAFIREQMAASESATNRAAA